MARGTLRALPTQAPNDIARVSASEWNARLLAELDGIRTALTGTGLRTPAGLDIGSTDDLISSNLFSYNVLGFPESKAPVPVGTSPPAQTVPIDKWALYLLSISVGGAITVTPAAANATTGYDTEALAIAALPATPAAQASMGYVTTLTAAGLAWIAATDAFEGGSSGNPASDTNYRDTVEVLTEAEGARSFQFSR